MKLVRRPFAVVIAALLVGACTTAPLSQDPTDGETQIPALRAPAGAINDDVTQESVQRTICVPGWTATVRPSSTYTNAVKTRLLREQGLPVADAQKYELDHFIPLALGGHPRNLENLWLQPWDGEWGARAKDRLEVKLKNLVCVGRLSLQAAREAITTDWRRSLKLFVRDAEHPDIPGESVD